MVAYGLWIITENIGWEVVFAGTIVLYFRITGSASVPRQRIRVVVGIITVDGQYSPMVFFIVLAQAAFYIDVPVLDRFEYKLNLIGYPVLFTGLFSTLFHLYNFHIGRPVSVGIDNRTSRPAACDVVEEQSCHISRTVIVFACPFVVIVHGNPIGKFHRNLSIQCITLELVATMT